MRGLGGHEQLSSLLCNSALKEALNAILYATPTHLSKRSTRCTYETS